ncbi:MAG: histidine phosphatase family protein [Pseudomonadota bacterium]
MKWLFFVLVFGMAPAHADDAFWDTMRQPGVQAVMRHAIAPGTGDPRDFTLGDCSTQRNLSETGRAQSRAIGAAFRENGITIDRVMSSQWCRCLDTAELLDLAPVEELESLNSFFRNRSLRDEQTEATLQWLAALPDGQKTLLVTHQVNVTALTGVYPTSGEIVAFSLKDQGDITVHGTLTIR